MLSLRYEILTDPKRHVMTEQNLRDAIDRYSELGINGFIITYPEDIHAGQGTYYPSRIFDELPMPVQFDVLGTILSQSSKNGQRVFVGLGRGADLLLTWTGFDDPHAQPGGANAQHEDRHRVMVSLFP